MTFEAPLEKIDYAAAATAIFNSVRDIAYRMRKYGMAYVDKGEAAYQAAYEERCIRNLHKQARRLGFELVNTASGEIVP